MKSSDSIDASAICDNRFSATVANNIGGDDNTDSSFLIQPEHETTAILLVDSSGSVLKAFSGNETVFDRFLRIASSLPHQQFRLIFWCDTYQSKQHDGQESFVDGVEKFPFVVKRDQLQNAFNIVRAKVQGGCLTMPSVAFDAVEEWLAHNFSKTVYFLTDGEIGFKSMQQSLRRQWHTTAADSIRRVFDKHRDVQLHILAVQDTPLSAEMLEGNVQAAVGNDIYRLIAENALTDVVSKFVSYGPNCIAGRAHIERTKVPVGFVPFGTTYFSIFDVPKFLPYLRRLIADAVDDEGKLLAIVQQLAPTMRVLTIDKASRVQSQIYAMFCDMFCNTALDTAFVKYILQGAVRAEQQGAAQLFSEYRAQLRNLYKATHKSLRDSVKNALQIDDFTTVVTLPIAQTLDKVENSNDDDNRQKVKFHILVNTGCAFTESVLGFKEAAYRLGADRVVPALPIIMHRNSQAMSQCVRQWVRALIGRQYAVNVMGDEIIIIVMRLNLQVQHYLATMQSQAAASETANKESAASLTFSLIGRVEEVAAMYRTLVGVMLDKKRLNSQQSELERLMEGNLFVPNDGNIDAFMQYLTRAGEAMGFGANNSDVPPLKLWYFLCLAYSKELADCQLVHCKAAVNSTECDHLLALPLPPTLHIDFLSEPLDYTCLVTMESTARTGGYAFVPHQNAVNNTCHPRQVLSQEGFDALFEQGRRAFAYCPICFTSLGADQFRPVPASAAQGVLAAADIAALQTDVFHQQSESNDNSRNNGKNCAPPKARVAPAGGTPGDLYVLIGTVGCGKTTYAKGLLELLLAAGYECSIEGSDKYVLQGFAFGAPAAQQVTHALRKAHGSTLAKKAIILDTCGEQFNARNVFDVDFSDWRIHRVWVNLERRMRDLYLAWSLRNVLRRAPTDEAVLRVDKCGLQTCIDVHKRKLKRLFGKKTKGPIENNNAVASKEDALRAVELAAQKYDVYLAENADRFMPRVAE